MVEVREVLADFMHQGHLTYRTTGRVSDYGRADAMIRDLTNEGVSILPRDDVDALRRALENAITLTKGRWSQAAIDAVVEDANKALSRTNGTATAPADVDKGAAGK